VLSDKISVAKSEAGKSFCSSLNVSAISFLKETIGFPHQNLRE
jgi:hypothetical protein